MKTLRKSSALVNASAAPMKPHSARPRARSSRDHQPMPTLFPAGSPHVLADHVQRLCSVALRVPVVYRARRLLEAGALLRREARDLEAGLAEGLEVLCLGLDDELALEAAGLARRVHQDRASGGGLLVEEWLVEHEHVGDEAVVREREVLLHLEEAHQRDGRDR